MPGIATNLPAERLRALQEAGVVVAEQAPPPLAATLRRPVRPGPRRRRRRADRLTAPPPKETAMPAVVNYFEIGSADAEAAGRFYGTLFDWTLGGSSPVGYRMVNDDQGGLWDTSQVGGGSWAIFYVQVDDVAASVRQAQELGATVALPLVDNGQIEFAHLVDPDGNRFGVWKPKQG